MPDAATVIASIPNPDRARLSIARAKNANAPESRKFATTIIIPSNSAIVWKSMARSAAPSLSAPDTTIATAPANAAPVRSMRAHGISPSAITA